MMIYLHGTEPKPRKQALRYISCRLYGLYDTTNTVCRSYKIGNSPAAMKDVDHEVSGDR